MIRTKTGLKSGTVEDYFELLDYGAITDKNSSSYNSNQVFNAGELILNNGIIYKTLLTHWVYQETSDNFNTFYQKVITVADLLAGIIPDWIQPTGAHDAYMKGAKVTYNGKVYVSNCDNNVWAPGVYGWDLAN